MGRLRRAEVGPPEDWIRYLVACRLDKKTLRKHLDDLYAYIGGEMGWAPSECDRHTLDHLVGWANARSQANERSSK